ncbi:MAG: 2-oxoglutarate dehydrogenase complex dihydrolipoyllysine-residue succinyltransferase [Candidatus Rokuibacteriota bacterium]
MRVELRVPAGGESITEVQVADWLKREGDRVRQDEPVVLLETDKAAVELPSPVSGVVAEIVKQKGEVANVGDILAYLDDAPAGDGSTAQPVTEPRPAGAAGDAGERAAAASPRVMPSARRPIAERGVAAEQVAPTGPGGQILKEDVPAAPAAPAPPRPTAPAPAVEPVTAAPETTIPAPAVERRAAAPREEEAVPMSLLRRRVAERLVQAQQTAALLTTFNEIDMSAVIALRRAHQEAFRQRHGVKLGFMSFFVKTAIEALKQLPGLNAEIRGTEIVYRNYYDIGIAVGGGRGLVVPVLRNAERSSFAEIETAIADFAGRAQANRLTPEELQGGTFTISNGGVYGSLLSTPIVNPPQSGVLGLHVIQDRPVARDGQVVVRPMMYVALTYDHRIVDGREAVSFLKHVKECMEDPARLLLEI